MTAEGIRFITNSNVGQEISAEELHKNNDAVSLKFLNLPYLWNNKSLTAYFILIFRSFCAWELPDPEICPFLVEKKPLEYILPWNSYKNGR